MSVPTPARGPGRPPGVSDRRERILEAARARFAADGYDRTSMRAIARDAEVDPALVHHYFGTKDAVFVASMALPFDPGAALPELLAGRPDTLGERMARFFLSFWERPDTREPFLVLLRSALTNEAAAAMLREFVGRVIVDRIAGSLDVPDARLRVSLAGSQLVGMALLRYVVRVEPLASASVDDVVRLVAPALQQHLTGTSAARRRPRRGP